MALRNPTDLKADLARGQRLLGLDMGGKTIGLAVSDPGLMIASPIRTLTRTKFTQDAQELARIRKEYTIGGLVIGLPRNMDGSEGPAAQSARQFAANLLERPDLIGGDIAITFWDERMSTMAVNRLMVDWDMTRKRRDEVVDKMAAAYILQGFLDGLKNSSTDR